MSTQIEVRRQSGRYIRELDQCRVSRLKNAYLQQRSDDQQGGHPQGDPQGDQQEGDQQISMFSDICQLCYHHSLYQDPVLDPSHVERAILLPEGSFIAPLSDTKPLDLKLNTINPHLSRQITQQTHILCPPSTDIQLLLQHAKRVWVGHLYIPYIVKRKLPEQDWPSHHVQVVLDALYPEG